MRRRAFELIIVDADYDSDACRAEITARGAEAVIRPRKNRTEDRPYDEVLYKLRIERFFHRLKQYSRVATLYDKYAVRYLGFVYFAAILITTKKCKHYVDLDGWVVMLTLKEKLST